MPITWPQPVMDRPGAVLLGPPYLEAQRPSRPRHKWKTPPHFSQLSTDHFIMFTSDFFNTLKNPLRLAPLPERSASPRNLAVEWGCGGTNGIGCSRGLLGRDGVGWCGVELDRGAKLSGKDEDLIYSEMNSKDRRGNAVNANCEEFDVSLWMYRR